MDIPYVLVFDRLNNSVVVSAAAQEFSVILHKTKESLKCLRFDRPNSVYYVPEDGRSARRCCQTAVVCPSLLVVLQLHELPKPHIIYYWLVHVVKFQAVQEVFNSVILCSSYGWVEIVNIEEKTNSSISYRGSAVDSFCNVNDMHLQVVMFTIHCVLRRSMEMELNGVVLRC
mgnify:FL=1